MASLQNVPYDLLLSIAQYLDLADIYALQLVRNSPLNMSLHKFLKHLAVRRRARRSAMLSVPAQCIGRWQLASSGVAARFHFMDSNAFPIFPRISLWKL